jgi:ribA/ribD-fused uncharacterized protein
MKYSVRTLSQESHLQRDDFIFFWKPNPAKDGKIQASCLSQWWLGSFQFKDIAYVCAEQWMMAEKARLFKDEKTLASILSSSDPRQVKALGQRVTPFDDQRWNKNKYAIVVFGNYLKFSQDSALAAYLDKTRGKILVETSPTDKIWGIGMAQEDKDVYTVSKWKGQNLLGFALMEVRDILVGNNTIDHPEFV